MQIPSRIAFGRTPDEAYEIYCKARHGTAVFCKLKYLGMPEPEDEEVARRIREDHERRKKRNKSE